MGIGGGCINLLRDALVTHEKSVIHKDAQARWINASEKKIKPIPDHILEVEDVNRERVITTLKTTYFVCQEDLSLSKYEKICKFLMDLRTPNMPKHQDYSTYTNRKGANDFLFCISKYLEQIQINEMLKSPFFSIMIDESTDQSLEQHLVVYAIYLTLEGHGAPISMFMKMMSVSDGKGKTIYDTINQLMNDRGISLTKLVAVSTDGASAMVGRENGFVSLMKQNIPNLISIHCIAHRESLLATNASKKELLFVEKIANKVHSWIQNSPKRNNELNELLRVMEIDVLNVLQIHTIRWLSRGEVIISLVKLMPAILTLWKKDKKCSTLYEKTRIYSVQFCLHMLADVLGELNKLNKIFQEENVDITVIGLALDEVIGNLYRWFLRKGTFAEGTTYLSKFLIDSQFGCIEVKEDGVTDKHEFLYVPILIEEFQSSDLGKHSMQPRIEGTKQSCQLLTEGYIQSLIESLNERSPDLPLFNAAKLFSPSYYPSDHQTQDNVSERWLDKLLQHLQHTTNNVSIFDVNGCKRELNSFVDSLHSSCEGFKMKDAWRVFGNTKYWHRSYPHMMKLWQVVLTIPASTVDCERGFSKQNIIKDVRKSKLALDTLDALMRVSLNRSKINDVN
ncbi:uncharacterized protein LOC131027099 [Cryptomeria japonica]|uniref:uncharacterized protein LOC131027099 n=1 Tax=Cryptomeria japonica TaxID=3369 RepID=UPI0027D9EBA2|nr:uncharacterized protein LOC131027099 [Cryptomeria japonica]